jgi:ABC-type lipoprotein release transport system permease subunit
LSRVTDARDLGMTIAQGRFINNADDHKAVVGAAFLKANKATVGQKIILKDPFGTDFTLEIVGAFNSDVQIYAADAVVTTVRTAREFFGFSPAQASDLCVYCSGTGKDNATAESIAKMDPTLRALTRTALTEMTVSAFGRRGGMLQLMWYILLLTVCVLAWAETSSVSLDERREIGTLKALGWDTADIVETKCMESIIVGMGSTLVGLCVGLAYSLAGAPGMKNYFLGWSSIYPEFPVPVYVSFASVALLLAIGVFPLVAATLVPAWLSGTVDADAAIRG